MMQYDTIELKWSIFEYHTNRLGKDFIQLVRYKEAGEKLETFLQESNGFRLVLHYFINGYSFTEYCNSLEGKQILELGNHYFNTLSFNLRPKSFRYDEKLAWERVTLKKLLCLPLTLEDIQHSWIWGEMLDTKEGENKFQKRLDEEIAYFTMLYGCGCKDTYCGGWGIYVEETKYSISWDINIRNHRKYVFEKEAYHNAFQEIRDYIERHTNKPL